MMDDEAGHKRLILNFIQAVWVGGDLDALDRFWAADCINHAAPAEASRGLAALRSYHEQFMEAFAAFSDFRNEILQQVSEGDRVVTQILSHARHTGPFLGIPATGRGVTLSAIRIDRIRDGKIAEHWSVSDVAGLMERIQG